MDFSRRVINVADYSFTELIEYARRYQRLAIMCDKDEKMTEEDNNFFYFYQMYLALAILSCMEEDDAKKVAKIILAQVE